MRNKILALLLALCMVMTLLPAMAFAGSEDDPDATPTPEATEEPTETEKPDPTETEEPTNTPKPTETPDPTATEKPEEVAKCDCGCGKPAAECDCSERSPCEHENCKWTYGTETVCVCGCVYGSCSKCKFDATAGKGTCGCGGKNYCLCFMEHPENLPANHCRCEEPGCTAASHVGGEDGTLCVTVVENGLLCDACKAYAAGESATPSAAPSAVPSAAPVTTTDTPKKAEDFSDVPAGLSARRAAPSPPRAPPPALRSWSSSPACWARTWSPPAPPGARPPPTGPLRPA